MHVVDDDVACCMQHTLGFLSSEQYDARCKVKMARTFEGVASPMVVELSGQQVTQSTTCRRVTVNISINKEVSE